MGEAFHHGGWGMYPTTIAGVVLVAAAIRYALTPDARRRHLVRALSMLTFLVGTLGFVAGTIRSFTAAGADGVAANDAFTGALAGVGESLNNIGLALSMLVVAGIFTAIGVFRTGKQPGGGAAELHGL